MYRRPSQLCHLSNRIIRHKEADLAALWDVAFLCDSAATTMLYTVWSIVCYHLLVLYVTKHTKQKQNKMEILLCSIQDLIKDKTALKRNFSSRQYPNFN